ncbi:MAG TPA: hypothetical protein VK592_03445, partial [Candidatus Dormibacteraeota bacterium]|nr:hypothetical protein [Candidatus Dormibacteraeota bacterium]
MTASTAPSPTAARLTPVTAWNRIYGFGSVYAKTLRDSRLAFIIVAGMLGGIMLAAGAAIPNVFPTQQAREEIVRLANELGGAAQGLAGKPVNVGTLGGYLQWKYGPVFLWIAALWSILALSSTLVSEARRGSLEFVAATAFARRRIALEKLAAHLTALFATLVITAAVAALVGAVFGSIPGDQISLQSAIGFAAWLGVMALWFGGLAWALAPFLGRGLGAGLAGVLLFAGYVASNFSGTVPAFAAIAVLTPWAWTADHLPLAGQFDWASLVPVALCGVVFLAIGTEAFVRRDIGATSRVRTPAMPGILLGENGATERSFGERLPMAIAWGLGLGSFGLVIGVLSVQVVDALQQSPDMMRVLGQMFPGIDLTTAGGMLQIVFVELGFIAAGFAAATLLAGWASDENSGRLELILATPLARRGWLVRSGLGVLLASAVMTAILALGVGLGCLMAGSDAITPMVGTGVMGLYTAALAGIGFAIGGLFRASLAGEVVALVVVATYVIDLLAPPLQLPNWFHQLALTAHLGQPM